MFSVQAKTCVMADKLVFIFTLFKFEWTNFQYKAKKGSVFQVSCWSVL